jgi:hypothetical protein
MKNINEIMGIYINCTSGFYNTTLEQQGYLIHDFISKFIEVEILYEESTKSDIHIDKPRMFNLQEINKKN